MYFQKPYRDVSYEREEQKEIQTHEPDTTVNQESASRGGTVNSKFNIAVRDKWVS
jgi:hypothetical protein